MNIIENVELYLELEKVKKIVEERGGSGELNISRRISIRGSFKWSGLFVVTEGDEATHSQEEGSSLGVAFKVGENKKMAAGSV